MNFFNLNYFWFSNDLVGSFAHRSSIESISAIFPKPEKRTSWEETFLEAKARLSEYTQLAKYITQLRVSFFRLSLFIITPWSSIFVSTCRYTSHDLKVCSSSDKYTHNILPYFIYHVQAYPYAHRVQLRFLLVFSDRPSYVRASRGTP